MTNIPDEGKLKDRWRKDGNAEGFKFDSVWCGSLWIIHEQQPNRVKRVVSLLCLSVFLFLPAPLAGPPLPFHTISHSVFSFSLPYSSTRRPPRTFFSHGFPLAPLAASLSTISYSFYHRPIRFLLYMYVCTTPSPSSASRSLTRFFLSSSVFFSHSSSISVNVFQSNDVSSRMKTNFPFPVFVLLRSICALVRPYSGAEFENSPSDRAARVRRKYPAESRDE